MRRGKAPAAVQTNSTACHGLATTVCRHAMHATHANIHLSTGFSRITAYLPVGDPPLPGRAPKYFWPPYVGPGHCPRPKTPQAVAGRRLWPLPGGARVVALRVSAAAFSRTKSTPW